MKLFLGKYVGVSYATSLQYDLYLDWVFRMCKFAFVRSARMRCCIWLALILQRRLTCFRRGHYSSCAK